MNIRSAREVCRPCNKFLNIGQAILECEICNIAIHTKCFNSANFCSKNDLWVCSPCSENMQPRYNPFRVQNYRGNDDKFYEDDEVHVDNKLQEISNVLDSCKTYTALEPHQSIKKLSQTSPTASLTSHSFFPLSQ